MKKPIQRIEKKLAPVISEICTKYGLHAAFALEVTFKITEALLPPQQSKIYKAMSKIPKTTHEIAKACKLQTKLVSSQLHQIYQGTGLIDFQKDLDHYKRWFKING